MSDIRYDSEMGYLIRQQENGIIEIGLELGKHCIETSAKKTYEKLVSGYFKASVSERESSEARIEALLFFLENADFGFLRTRYPELNGGNDLCVTLRVLSDPYLMSIGWDRNRIIPEWKRR